MFAIAKFINFQISIYGSAQVIVFLANVKTGLHQSTVTTHTLSVLLLYFSANYLNT